MNVILIIAAAGGIGACLRWLVDTSIKRRWHASFPLSTFIINCIGAIAIGTFTALSYRISLENPNETIALTWLYILPIGLCGGFSTLSAMMFETITLLYNRNVKVALCYTLATVTVPLTLGYIAYQLIAGA